VGKRQSHSSRGGKGKLKAMRGVKQGLGRSDMGGREK